MPNKKTIAFLKERNLACLPMHLSQFRNFLRKLTFFLGGIALTPLDFFLWKYIKTRVNDTADLKERIEQGIKTRHWKMFLMVL